MSHTYCPKRGDVIWLSFEPQAGHEQAGHRPALTLSPEFYNRRTGVGVFCPITSQIKDYPFEVVVPPGFKATGAIMADHVKSLDWTVRGSRFLCKLPDAVVSEVLGKLNALLMG